MASQRAGAAGKAARKGARKPVGRPFQKGHDARRNVTTPGTGRPPDKYREYVAELLATPGCEAAVGLIIRDPDHPAFATMYKALADRAYGKPAQAIALTGSDGGPAVVEVIRRVIRVA